MATVSPRGLLTTTTDTGITEVKAHDLENPMHFGFAQVYSMIPFLEVGVCQPTKCSVYNIFIITMSELLQFFRYMCYLQIT